MTPKETIDHIAEVAIAIGWQAGVGQMETAGSIISYLANNPGQIEDFMAGRVSPVDWPDFVNGGCLTWHGMDGKIHSPNEVRKESERPVPYQAETDRSSPAANPNADGVGEVAAQDAWDVKRGLLDAEQLRAALRSRVDEAGGVMNWSSNDLCDEQVYAFLRGKRPPEPKILKAMGFEKVTFYREVRP